MSAGERKKDVEGDSRDERRQNPHLPLWKKERSEITKCSWFGEGEIGR